MSETWRLLDTGLGSPGGTVALSRAILEARAADEVPSTLRFFRCTHAVLLGARQSAAQELAPGMPEACLLGRRITGGPAWVVDDRQLMWELYLHRGDVGTVDLQTVTRRVLHAAATALSALGIDARYRSPDEIEIEGRTVALAGAMAEGAGVLVQGVLWIAPITDRMSESLRWPQSEPAALRARFTALASCMDRQPDLRTVKRNLAEAFESEFAVEFSESDLTLTEHARQRRAVAEIETPDWIGCYSQPAGLVTTGEASWKIAAGVLRAAIRYDAQNEVIRAAWFGGDVQMKPRRSLLDLESTLRNVPPSRLEPRIERFFASHVVQCEGIQPVDFLTVLRVAMGQQLAA